MKTTTIHITDPKAIANIKRMVADKEYISKKVREGKFNEIATERPDIKFGKPI